MNNATLSIYSVLKDANFLHHFNLTIGDLKMAKILRKLTIASTGWTKGAIQAALFAKSETPGQAPEDGTDVELMKIVGVTTMARPGQTDKGEYLKLIGEFTAINMDDGEVFTAASCILPNFISDSLAAALATSPQVEFALLIGAEASAKSVSGYIFTVTPLIEAKPSNAMAALLAHVAPAQAALEAPAAPAKKAALEAPAAPAKKAKK